jgi:hypothetical protein
MAWRNGEIAFATLLNKNAKFCLKKQTLLEQKWMDALITVAK